MESFSTGVLLVLLMAAFLNYRDGKLGTWLKAKFLNAAAPGKGDKGSLLGLGGLIKLANTPRSSNATTGGAGGWVAPLAGVTEFHPFGDGRNHPGVDLTFSGANGAPIHAARGGKVTIAGASGGYGLLVEIDHGDGYASRYGHCSKIEVHVGDTVSAGQEIAKVGATGDATGPHLHFEIRKNGTPVDPCPIDPAACAGAPRAVNV